MSDKVVLAYSGGLDTSVAIKWLKEKYKLDVIAVTIDVGNERDFSAVRQKALDVGAIKAVVIDAKETFVNHFVFPALQADAIYEGQYSLATALSRPLMAKLLVDVALGEGASAVAHGCTGKGNDQVRFEVSINALAPALKIIAPAREWGMTREETINYAQHHNIPIPITIASPYSIDECLWGKSIECGALEDPWVEPPEDAFTWTRSADKAPDKPAYVEIGFEKGIPVTIDGQELDGITLIQQLNELVGKHGIGRVDHVENRLVGIKSREIYEAPAATVLLQAHQALEAMTLSKDQLRFKQKVAVEYADLIYNGLWFTRFHQDLAAYVSSTQCFVSGIVRLKLFKGSSGIVGRKSPFSLYSHGLATYDKGDQFDQSASPGFIHIWGLPVRNQAQVQGISSLEEKDKPTLSIPDKALQTAKAKFSGLPFSRQMLHKATENVYGCRIKLGSFLTADWTVNEKSGYEFDQKSRRWYKRHPILFKREDGLFELYDRLCHGSWTRVNGEPERTD